MSEIIADVDTTVVSPEGREYYVQAVGEQLPTGLWAAWLEFVPLDDTLDVLITKTETTHATRDDVVRWTTTLTPVYLEGAFGRALRATEDPTLVREYETVIDSAVVPFDPFEVFRLVGKTGLRARLRPLMRSELLGMIQQYELNPARKSLSRLSDSQLVTFIATAVEVQTIQGRA